jgi:hypothetical protein
VQAHGSNGSGSSGLVAATAYDPALAGTRQPLHPLLQFMVPAFDKLQSGDVSIVRTALGSILDNLCYMDPSHALGTSSEEERKTNSKQVLASCLSFVSFSDEDVLDSLSSRLAPSLSLLLDVGLPTRLQHTLALFNLASKVHGWNNAGHAAEASEGPLDRRLILLLHRLHRLDPRIGYRFLHHLHLLFQDQQQQQQQQQYGQGHPGGQADGPELMVSYVSADLFAPMDAYVSFLATFSPQLAPEDALLKDLVACHTASADVFFELVPFVYAHLPWLAIGSSEIMSLLCSNLDARHTLTLANQLSLGNANMFRAVGETPAAATAIIFTMLRKTLSWQTFEQLVLWQLLTAELSRFPDVAGSLLQNMLVTIAPAEHPEATSGLLSLAAISTVTPGFRIPLFILLLPHHHHHLQGVGLLS